MHGSAKASHPVKQGHFVLSELPLMIICGNSNRMIEIVENSLNSNSIMFSKPRFGIIRVEKL